MKKLIILSLSLLSVSCAGASQNPDQNFSPESHARKNGAESTFSKKSFACTELGCSYRTTRRSNLIRHMRTHKLKKN